MASTIEINGKSLCPIKEAAQIVSYSRDYITRLAREEKIVATHIGRQWFVDIDSLKNYVEASTLEQEIRKKQLSEERKRERDIREASLRQNSLHLKKVRTLHVKAVSVASLVLMSGLLGGLAMSSYFSNLSSSPSQVATAQNSKPVLPAEAAVTKAVAVNDKQEASVAGDAAPSREVRSMGDLETGILLLPVGSSTTIESVLSDRVVVRESSEGVQMVVRVDSDGNVIGNEIPFVLVPVERQEI